MDLFRSLDKLLQHFLVAVDAFEDLPLDSLSSSRYPRLLIEGLVLVLVTLSAAADDVPLDHVGHLLCRGLHLGQQLNVLRVHGLLLLERQRWKLFAVFLYLLQAAVFTSSDVLQLSCELCFLLDLLCFRLLKQGHFVLLRGFSLGFSIDFNHILLHELLQAFKLTKEAVLN